MKTLIFFFSVLFGILINCQGIWCLSSNSFTDIASEGKWEAKTIENTLINPPLIKISPDTLDGGGTVCIQITIANPNDDFSYAYVTITNPDFIESQYSFGSYDLVNNVHTFYYEVRNYFPSGYWYISSITLYYAEDEITLDAAAIHSGFFVKNTLPDITPPVIKYFNTSRDTAYPGDTVCITAVIEDTGSGLASWNIDIRDTTDYISYYNNSYDYYEDRNKKIDTLQFFYTIGIYETAGNRHANLSVSDNAGYYFFYDQNALNFNLRVIGTIEDKQPPVVKGVTLTNNSQNGEIILEVVAMDDISGLLSFSAWIMNTVENSYSFEYQSNNPSYSDFVKMNDTVYRCNMLLKEPYLPSGSYSLNLTLIDQANNYSNLDNYKILTITNVNSDALPPEIIYLEFNKDTVIAGDPVILSMRLSDDKSGLKRFSLFLGNERSGSSIYFSHSFIEPGTVDYIFTKTFKLSEFGPGGKWTVTYLSVQDYTGKWDYTTEWPGFYYYSKYIDTIPPVLESFVIEPKTVNAGDTVTVTIVATDNLSGIKNIGYYNDNDDFYAYWMRQSWFMTAPDTYELKIPINKYAKADTITYSLDRINDAAGNENYIGRHGTAYTIISSGDIDTLPPVFDSLSISDTIVNQEDTITLTFYLHDDKSGINPYLLYAYFWHEMGNESYNSDEESDQLIVFPRYVNEKEYLARLSTNVLDSGIYNLVFVGISDMAGNYSYPVGVDYSPLPGNNTFRVTGRHLADSDDPILVNIKISPEIVHPSDTLSIEIIAVDKGSGISTLTGTIGNMNGVDRDLLNYNSWEISGFNDTFKCRTIYVIPEDATNGKWVIGYLSIIDYYEHVGSLEYGIDYFDADFMVTGGQSYPNRPPTWVISEINLTIDAGNQLNYEIPKYIINDIDGDTLIYSAVMENGNSLVSWMNFSSTDLDLDFNPVKEDKGVYRIYVIASDPFGLSDSIPVNITVNYDTRLPQQQDVKLRIYPNPAVDYIFIEYPHAVKCVALYDLTGKKVYENHTITNKINVFGLNKGTYILTVETDRMTIIEKVNVL